MTEKTCGNCQHIFIVDGQPYHDCRERSPQVIVPSFKDSESTSNTRIGKIMTVWPRVSTSERGCGKFSAKD